MPAPDVHISWDDQSFIPSSWKKPQEDYIDYPIYMTIFTSDKGPEEWTFALDYNQFKARYGETASFERHGQPLVQAHMAGSSGARLTCKRVVAEDATLANIGVVAKLTTSSVQYTDSAGVPMYFIDAANQAIGLPSGIMGPTPTSYPVMVDNINIEYQLVSVVLANNDVKTFANTFYAAYHHTNSLGQADQYALFLIMDNGRGESNKRFRIYRDTSRSAPVTYVRYFIEVSENGQILETLPFTMNPNIIEKDRSTSLSDVILRRSSQLRAVIFEDEFKAFTDNVDYIAGLTNEYAFADCLFGTDFYGNPYTSTPNYNSITVSTTPVNLSTIYGIQLVNGSNGLFGNRPIASPTYSTQLCSQFNADDCIYDVDNVRIDAIFDANYPEVLKRYIENLANFREDFVYFRDLGLNVHNFDDIKIIYNTTSLSRSRFCATYITSYDVYDMFSRKQISVTMTYHLASLFVTHFINGRSRPFCGQKYGVTIPTDDIIPGTVNYLPKRTPAVDQKEELDTLRINYATYYEGNIFTVACEYTSQVAYTQLSFINNVLSVQEVIKAIRVVCPKIRYSFIDEGSEELARYKEDINNLIIAKYADRFKSFSIEFQQDELTTLNKVIYAVIYVKFRDFVQTEYFTITALV